MVHGKFDGPVIRVQGQTRLQTNFVNGEKAGGWSEPGSTVAHSPTPAPTEQRPKIAEPKPTEEPSFEPSPLPMPSPSPTRSATPTPTPRPTPRAKPTSTPMPSPTMSSSPTPTPSPKPTATPITTQTPTPKPLRSSMPSPVEQPAKKDFRLDSVVGGRVDESLQLGSPPSSLPSPAKTLPRPRPSASSPIAQSASPAASPPGVDPTEKHRMIEELRKQTESVLVQVRDATGNFRDVDRLEAMKNLPAPVSVSVTVLTARAEAFRMTVGYEVAAYECLAEMEAVEALALLDEITRDIVAKDTPVARKKLSAFLKRYHEPTADNQKPLSRYLNSVLSLCNRLKNEAETHLPRAQSLGSAGKTSEALREYQEIYRIYPNPITAERIRQLEAQPR
jgi:hypothetical protein